MKKEAQKGDSKLYKISLKPLKNGWFEALFFYKFISCKVLKSFSAQKRKKSPAHY